MSSNHSNAPSPRPVRILLTGFGPFPTVANNASAGLVAALAKRARDEFPDCKIMFAVLPTEWEKAPAQLGGLLAGFEPDIVLSFGVARDATGFRIETQGLNACRLAPDAAGQPPFGSVLRANGPISHACTAPLMAIIDRLGACGLPVSLSDDAGGYLCNAVFYHTLEAAAARGGGMSVAFIHIPADLSTGPLTFEMALSGAIEIIRASLQSVPVND